MDCRFDSYRVILNIKVFITVEFSKLLKFSLRRTIQLGLASSTFGIDQRCGPKRRAFEVTAARWSQPIAEIILLFGD
jgi:hypothetical protein